MVLQYYHPATKDLSTPEIAKDRMTKRVTFTLLPFKEKSGADLVQLRAVLLGRSFHQ